MLDRLQNGIFWKRVRVATRPSATTQKPMEIQDCNDENDEKGVGV